MATHSLAITKCFEQIEDPRIERTKFHTISDILTLSVLAVIAGAEGWEDIEQFGHDKHELLKQYLPLANGIPSHDTISRLFRALKPAAFQEALMQWFDSLPEMLGFRRVLLMAKHCGVRTTKTRCNPLCIWCVRGAWKIILYWASKPPPPKATRSPRSPNC